MTEPDYACREIVVVPPGGVVFDDAGKLQQIRDFLARSFPDFTFVVGSNEGMRGPGFSLYPVLGVAGDDKVSRMVGAPAKSMRRIAEALRDAFEDGWARLQ